MNRTSINLAVDGGLRRPRGTPAPRRRTRPRPPRARLRRRGRRARRRRAARSSIPRSTSTYLLKERLAQGQPDTPELRNAIRDELNTRELLVREAKKKGLDKNTDVKNQTDLAAQTVLVRAYVADWIKANPIPEAALRKEYDTIKSQMGDKEYKVRHILVEKEDEAKDIIAELQKGEQVREARRALEGHGLEGQRRRSRLERAGQFRQAVLRGDGQAAEGQVHRDAGADAVRLARDRGRRTSATRRCRRFEEVKPQLQQRMQGQYLDNYFKELRAKNGHVSQFRGIVAAKRYARAGTRVGVRERGGGAHGGVVRSPKDFVAGSDVHRVGIAAIVDRVSNYTLGTAARMGPGLLPAHPRHPADRPRRDARAARAAAAGRAAARLASGGRRSSCWAASSSSASSSTTPGSCSRRSS